MQLEIHERSIKNPQKSPKTARIFHLMSVTIKLGLDSFGVISAFVRITKQQQITSDSDRRDMVMELFV